MLWCFFHSITIAIAHTVHLMNRLTAGWPPTLSPSQPTWAVSPPMCCHRPHSSSPFIITIIYTPKAGSSHMSSYSSLEPYVRLQIMVAATLLLKCLTVTYFSQSECKTLNDVFRNFYQYHIEIFHGTDKW